MKFDFRKVDGMAVGFGPSTIFVRTPHGDQDIDVEGFNPSILQGHEVRIIYASHNNFASSRVCRVANRSTNRSWNKNLGSGDFSAGVTMLGWLGLIMSGLGLMVVSQSGSFQEGRTFWGWALAIGLVFFIGGFLIKGSRGAQFQKSLQEYTKTISTKSGVSAA